MFINVVQLLICAGEPGLLVGKIVKGRPLREFDGYANPEATKKKIAHNVVKKGDCYFLTGELFYCTFCFFHYLQI